MKSGQKNRLYSMSLYFILFYGRQYISFCCRKPDIKNSNLYDDKLDWFRERKIPSECSVCQKVFSDSSASSLLYNFLSSFLTPLHTYNRKESLTFT